jgi:hypothetical protein
VGDGHETQAKIVQIKEGTENEAFKTVGGKVMMSDIEEHIEKYNGCSYLHKMKSTSQFIT